MHEGEFQVFEHQFEDMKEYMKVKEIQDSKNFTARRLRATERAREKELRRAEYDPEGFFRPGTAASAASMVRQSPAQPLCPFKPHVAAGFALGAGRLSHVEW